MRHRNWLGCIALLILSAALASAQLVITTASLPDGSLGAEYSQTLSASVVYDLETNWSIVSGQLPHGLTLSSDGPDAFISGTPDSPGLFSFTVQVTQTDSSEELASATKALTIFIPGSELAISTTSLPAGRTGAAYSQTFSAAGLGEGDVLTWTLYSGYLPAGLALAPNGMLSGAPALSGSFSFVVQVSDRSPSGGVNVVSASFTLIIVAAPTVAITTNSSLPPGTVGVGYTQQIIATGGVSPYSWSVASGALPDGVRLDGTTGVISGTPARAGLFTFLLVVSDQSGISGVGAFALNILAPLAISTGSPLPSGAVGMPYEVQVQASGGVPSYAWSVASGALPGGVSLSASTGVISGTPASAGTFNFELAVSDQSGGKASGAFVIVVTTPLAISTEALSGGAIGTPYASTFAATGGSPPYTWSMTAQSGSLPPGLTLDPSTATLAGTPTAAGVYEVLATVTDTARRTASKHFSVTVSNALAITNTSPLPSGAIGSSYQLQLTATGGTPAYTWSIATGALPAGLALDAATGMLAGTPTAGGAFDVTIGVKDAVQSVTRHFSLTITVPALPAVTITGLSDTPTPATQPQLGIGIGAAYSLDITGQALLTFAPDTASDDPAVQFTSGGRNVNFQIPAGATQAVFSTSTLGVQTGTVAGTITITLQIFASGADVTPTPPPTRVLRIAAGPPVITSASLVANTTGFSLNVVGYATSREVTGATIHLTAASGATLGTSDFNIPLTTVFSTWYQDPASTQFGSQFTLSIPFTVQNVANAVGSLTVTLANSQGSSTAANATF